MMSALGTSIKQRLRGFHTAEQCQIQTGGGDQKSLCQLHLWMVPSHGGAVQGEAVLGGRRASRGRRHRGHLGDPLEADADVAVVVAAAAVAYSALTAGLGVRRRGHQIALRVGVEI